MSFRFGDTRKSLASLSGVIVGIGEVLGGILFGFMGHWTLKHGRDPIVILGFILSMVSYFFIFVNIPMNAISDELDPWEYGYIKPNIHLTLFTSFLLGSLVDFFSPIQRIQTKNLNETYGIIVKITD